ncbi:unnamed protein product [Spirodela intermedia]|uniref:Uncharacterized protein n=1 Tax=Spirodela intermedia TaxID=51605 RepID=A0A7I8JSV9_SPIIN|nr:unnamed protein product [Spirodela intermedia]CAA6672831.1 unnamed protein product [Spirodela intermedia]
MATANPFDLLGDDDSDDPSLLIAAQQQKNRRQETSPVAAGATIGKLPAKPPPPAQAGYQERQRTNAWWFSWRHWWWPRRSGRGRGGRGGGPGQGRDFENGNLNGLSGGYGGAGGGGEDGDKGRPLDRERALRWPTSAVPWRPPRWIRAPGRVYERRSGTGRGYENKREGYGRGNWGKPTEMLLHMMLINMHSINIISDSVVVSKRQTEIPSWLMYATLKTSLGQRKLYVVDECFIRIGRLRHSRDKRLVSSYNFSRVYMRLFLVGEPGGNGRWVVELEFAVFFIFSPQVLPSVFFFSAGQY